MKCPACTFVCSDLRDVCPKCLLDLRDHKKALGMAITHPDVPYDVLIEKISTGKPKEQKPDPFLAFAEGLTKFFTATSAKTPGAAPIPKIVVEPSTRHVPKRDAEVKPIETPSFPAEAKIAPHVTQESTAIELSPPQKEKSGESAHFFQSEAQAFVPPPSQAIRHESAPRSEPLQEVKSSHEFIPDIIPSVEQREGSLPQESLAAVEPASPVVSEPSAPSASSNGVHSETPLPAAYSPIGILGSYSSAKKERLLQEKPEIDVLFDSSLRDLILGATEESIEMSVQQFQKLADREDIKLLFDLALTSFEDPNKEKLLKTELVKSDTRHVEAKELTQQLATVEKKLSSSFLSLKGWKGLRTRTEDEEVVLKAPEKFIEPFVVPVAEMELPSLWQRFGAFLIDAAAIVVFGILGALLYGYFGDSELWAAFANFDEPDALQFVLLAQYVLIGITLSLLLYPFICNYFFSKTFGTWARRLLILCEDGRALKPAQSAVRGLLFPLSFFLFGWIPMLRKERPLHDRLSRTIVCRNPEYIYKFLSISEEGEEERAAPAK